MWFGLKAARQAVQCGRKAQKKNGRAEQRNILKGDGELETGRKGLQGTKMLTVNHM